MHGYNINNMNEDCWVEICVNGVHDTVISNFTFKFVYHRDHCGTGMYDASYRRPLLSS